MQSSLSGELATKLGAMAKRSSAILVSMLLGLSVSLLAQTHGQKVWFADGYVQRGFILPQQDHYYYMLRGNTLSANIAVGIQPDGHKKYDRDHFYINRGFGFQYIDFGSPRILGNAMALYWFSQFRIKKSATLDQRFQGGVGVSYITRPFNQYNNLENLAIGSHINVYLNASYDHYLRILPRQYLLMSAGIFHYSNGKVSVPNLGLNSVGLRFGYRYVFDEEKYQTVPRDTLPFEPYYNICINVGTGFKEEVPVDNLKYQNYNLTLYASRFGTPTHAWGLGIESMLEKSAQYRIFLSTGEWMEWKDYMQLGAFVMHTFRFGNLDLHLQASLYLRNRAPVLSKNMYNKMMLQYHLSPAWYGFISLKVHFVEADYIGFGIGHRWELNRK